MTDLIERLRRRVEAHTDSPLGVLLCEAADTLEEARAEREVIGAEAVKYADKSGRLEAKVERLTEALRWYVENDDTNKRQKGNKYWLAERDRAIATLRDHDKEESLWKRLK